VAKPTEDFKSAAYSKLTVSDLLFYASADGAEDAKFNSHRSWAQYNGVTRKNGIAGSFADIIASFGGATGFTCYEGGAAAELSFPLSDGTFRKTGTVCDTNLYFNPMDQEGTTTCARGRHEYSLQAFGPAWSRAHNAACTPGLDDPAGASLFGYVGVVNGCDRLACACLRLESCMPSSCGVQPWERVVFAGAGPVRCPACASS